MENTNYKVIFKKAKALLYKKATIRGSIDRGKSPEEVRLDKDKINEIDYCVDIQSGKIFIKCYYDGKKSTFYYWPKTSQEIEMWKGLIEYLAKGIEENPFDQDLEDLEDPI